MMTEKVALDLFAQVMALAGPARNDILEYIGQTDISTGDLVLAMRDSSPSDPVANDENKSAPA